MQYDFILRNEGKHCINKSIKWKVNKIGKEIVIMVIFITEINLKNGFIN